MFHSLKRAIALIIGGAVIFVLSGCSDSSDSSDSSPEDMPPSSETGTMTLLVTDAESDRFNEILVTIDEVVLIADGDDGHQEVLMDEPVTINLRDLTDFSEFLAEADVDAGTYSKLRLVVSSIELNELDQDGNLVDSQTVNVPSGKIDLNPREAFVVNQGDEKVVLIDFDAANSFKVVQTGSGMFRFRPVVFIDIIGDGDDDVPARLIRQHGQITNLDRAESAFELCSLDMISAGDSDLLNTDDCINVEYGDGTAIYTDGTTPATAEDLVENGEVTVIGHVDNSEDGIVVDAVVLAMGEVDNIAEVEGQTATAVSEGSFDLTTDPDQGFPETLSIALQDNAVLFERHGGELIEPSALETGRPVTVFGASDAEVSDQFNAIAVSVANDEEAEGSEVEGTVASIDGSTINVTVEEDGVTSESCVQLQTDTQIQISTETADGEAVEEGAQADLAAGMEIEVTGSLNDSGCLAADLVIIEQEETGTEA